MKEEEKLLFEQERVQQIVGLIGKENFFKLCKEFGGESVYFPKSVLTYLEHQKIREEFKDGAGYVELAHKYGYTTQRIRMIVVQKKQEKLQKELFNS